MRRAGSEAKKKEKQLFWDSKKKGEEPGEEARQGKRYQENFGKESIAEFTKNIIVGGGPDVNNIPGATIRCPQIYTTILLA